MLLERAFAVAFIIIALSHILQPRAWVAFFAALARSGNAAFAIGMPTLAMGLVVVVWHNVWVWDVPVILTVYGWASVLKGSLYLLCPSLPDRMIKGPGSHPRGYVVGGVLLLALGGALFWRAYLR